MNIISVESEGRKIADIGTAELERPVMTEVWEMEYYMRRGKRFYFRDKKDKIFVQVKDPERFSDLISYGDIVNVELVQ